MKIKTCHILFRFFSFLSDKTNGAPFVVKYKLMLGTLILGLSATSCHKPKAVATCNEEEPAKANTIKVLSNDTTVSATKDTIGEHISPKLVSAKVPKIPPPAIITCYDTIASQPEQIETCYMPAFSDMERDKIYEYEELKKTPVSPVGNLKKFTEWICENIEYPESMIVNEEQGRVTIRFIIDKKGKITNINILRTFSPDADKEVMRLLKLSPDWTPGEYKGFKVKTKVTIPVVFRLPQD
ncbi:energy transducer TonB [Dysgonomonas sp. 25]|uniref:energy transducer TonB n=1 Tax=Dysgonomonas sp. 25 TaxID=2302933 RepID=UPI0013D3067E|nr:energy transducer TonB [Dysgonomonas sp. 25]NDV67391.1 energy transducer TonB [Dysgonomonas sp. 25]